MQKTSFTLRPMQANDVKDGMRLSTAEGWNQTEKDWKFFIENTNNICVVAEAGKKVIGTITAINYSNEVAWIGMVLVDKDYRGRRISKMLLEYVLEKLKSFKSIKLDATLAGREVYKKFGFKDEYSITRMTLTFNQNSTATEKKNVLVEPIQSKDITRIIKLDEDVFGTGRSQLTEYLIKEYPHKAYLLKDNNDISAFALGRDGNKYHQIGPVIADTINDAKILIAKALKDLNNQPLVVDVLNDKEELITWLQSLGFIKQREFARMYKNENLFRGIVDKHFLICGPEFG
jgi:ribosomal protein S18 acetylase RimI-like enzyme